MKYAAPANLPTKKFPLHSKKMRISPLFEGMDACAKLKSLAAAGFFFAIDKKTPVKGRFLYKNFIF